VLPIKGQRGAQEKAVKSNDQPCRRKAGKLLPRRPTGEIAKRDVICSNFRYRGTERAQKSRHTNRRKLNL